MLKRINILRTAVVLGAALLVVLQTGCADRPAEIPITTSSEEARAVFLEAREKFEDIRFDEARELFDQAIELDPDFAQAYLYRTFVVTSNRDFQNHMDRAVALAPDASEGECLMIEAQQAFAENNPVKAMELYEKLVRKFPKDKRAHWTLGWAYGTRDENDKAIAELEKATDIDQDFAPAYNILGYIYLAKGEYEQSEEAFKNYIRLIPEEPNPYDSMAELYQKMGRFEASTEHYQQALERKPDFLNAQRMIGINLIFMDRFDEGRAAIRQGMDQRVTPSARVSDQAAICRSYLYEADNEQALAAADQAIAMATEANLPGWEAGQHIAKCAIYVWMNEPDQAEQSLAACRQVVEGSDLSATVKENYAKNALFSEALIAAKRQDFETAQATAEQLKTRIEEGPDPDELEELYYPLMGRIYLDQGAHEDAIEQLEKADQEDLFALYHLALAHSGAGHNEKASEVFTKVAHWNEDSYNFALVRAKALAALGE